MTTPAKKSATKKETKPKPAGYVFGAPTKYDPSYCERVIELGREGKSVAQISAILDLSKKTIYNWMESHEDFLHAINESKHLAEAWFEEQMQVGLWSKEFNAQLWNKAVSARFRSSYGDRTAIEHSGQIDSKVSIVDFSQAQ